MAGKYNTWLRRKLADRIRSNGGYYSRHEQYALVWMVRIYDVGGSDAEEAAELLVECGHFHNTADLTLQFPDFNEWYEGEISIRDVWEEVLEHLQNDLGDDEGMRMWSPDTAKRYGFDYRGEGADKPFHMCLKGVSSGGKRVALSMFDCEGLEISNKELADAVDPDIEHEYNYDRQFRNQWCRKLMGIMDELDTCLTTENATRCGRYYAADYIARHLGLFD